MKHASAFSQLGHEVEVLSVERLYEHKLGKKIPDIFAWYGIDRIPVKLFRDRSMRFYLDTYLGARLFHVLRTMKLDKVFPANDPERAISEYCSEQNFDICYCRAFSCAYYNLQREVPTIVETHGAHPELNRVIPYLARYFEQEHFLKLVTIHQAIADKYIEMGLPESKVLVAEDAVDIERFDAIEEPKDELRSTLGLPRGGRIVTYAGSLKPGKGIRTILRTARQLRQYSNVQFLIVGGENSEVARWQREAERCGVENVIWAGFVANEMIPQYLKSSDALFMPYDLRERKAVMDINTTSPIKLFEYMAARRPIVTAEIATISKILRHESEAILVPPGDDYAPAIMTVLGNPDLAKRLVEGAYSTVQRYTYKKRGRAILS